MSDIQTNSPNFIKTEKALQVILVMIDKTGKIIAFENVGTNPLSTILRHHASEGSGYPLSKVENFFQPLGVDCFTTEDEYYIKGLSSAFTHLGYTKTKEMIDCIDLYDIMYFNFLVLQ